MRDGLGRFLLFGATLVGVAVCILAVLVMRGQFEAESEIVSESRTTPLPPVGISIQTASATATASQTASATVTATASATLTPSATATATPSPTATPSLTATATVTPIPISAVLQTIRGTAWLETARAVVSFPDVYGEEDRPGPLTGNASSHLNAVFTVTAGLDLSLIEERHLRAEGATLFVRLPPVQIRDCIYDNEKSFYYDERCALLGVVGGCESLRETLRAQAFALVASDPHAELMAAAERERQRALETLLLGVNGVERVVIETGEQTPPRLSEGGTCTQYDGLP